MVVACACVNRIIIGIASDNGIVAVARVDCSVVGADEFVVILFAALVLNVVGDCVVARTCDYRDAYAAEIFDEIISVADVNHCAMRIDNGKQSAVVGMNFAAPAVNGIVVVARVNRDSSSTVIGDFVVAVARVN